MGLTPSRPSSHSLSVKKTSRLLLSWYYLDLKPNSITSNDFHTDRNQWSSPCASRLSPGARSEGGTEALKESSNLADSLALSDTEESLAESPSLSETLRSLRQAFVVPRRKGKSAKKTFATSKPSVQETLQQPETPPFVADSGSPQVRSKLLDELHHPLENEDGRSGGATADKLVDSDEAKKMIER